MNYKNPYFIDPQAYLNGFMATTSPLIMANLIMTSIMLSSFGINMIDAIPDHMKPQKSN